MAKNNRNQLFCSSNTEQVSLNSTIKIFTQIQLKNPYPSKSNISLKLINKEINNIKEHLKRSLLLINSNSLKVELAMFEAQRTYANAAVTRTEMSKFLKNKYLNIKYVA